MGRRTLSVINLNSIFVVAEVRNLELFFGNVVGVVSEVFERVSVRVSSLGYQKRSKVDRGTQIMLCPFISKKTG